MSNCSGRRAIKKSVAHRETELILDGLRILTSGRPSRDVFKSLLDLLAPAIEFHDSVVLQRDWSNKIVATAGTKQSLIDIPWQEAAESLFAIDEVATTLRIPEELSVPALQDSFGSALAIKLRGGSKATILLCLHRDHDFFVARHLGLGARLSLVASQAFMNEEERQKVVDSSKLATIGEMAAGIVHEIRQPLTAMTLAVNNLAAMLAPEQQLRPRQNRSEGRADQNADRARDKDRRQYEGARAPLRRRARTVPHRRRRV